MPPNEQRRPRIQHSGSAADVQHYGTTSVDPTATFDAPTWHLEAEAHLRQAGRALEVLGLVDGESARMALLVYRLASRVRTDRTAVP